MGDWDWPDLYNRRRPSGASSLPDDSVGGSQSLSGEGGRSDAEREAKRQARAEQRRERRAREGSRGRPLQESAVDLTSDGAGETSSSPEPAPSPAVLAQVAALKSAAVNGNPFCEE